MMLIMMMMMMMVNKNVNNVKCTRSLLHSLGLNKFCAIRCANIRSRGFILTDPLLLCSSSLHFDI